MPVQKCGDSSILILLKMTLKSKPPAKCAGGFDYCNSEAI